MKEGICFKEVQEKGIQLLDLGAISPQIELLIRADYVVKLFSGLLFQLKCGFVATKTHLGWLVMGKANLCQSLCHISVS